MTEALYYAKGLHVWKRSVETPDPQRPGFTNIALGFRVCEVSEWLGEEGAQTIALMLSEAEGADDTEPSTAQEREVANNASVPGL